MSVSGNRGKLCGAVASLSLCEQLNSTNIARVGEMVARAKGIGRVYIGSSFCCRYLFQAAEDVFDEILEICERLGLQVTLVLPIATQRFLPSMLDLLNDFSKRDKTITEITCNDHGMLAHCSANLPQRVNIGRLFSKDTREVRQPGFTDMALIPSILERDLDSIFPMEGISSIELDAVHKFQDVQCAPQDREIALYMDWCYQTTGMICEQAATFAPVRQKFRPGAPCTGECQHFSIFYDGQMGFPYFKHGSTVYYHQKDAALIGNSSYRRIYSPLLTEIFMPDSRDAAWDAFMEEAA